MSLNRDEIIGTKPIGTGRARDRESGRSSRPVSRPDLPVPRPDSCPVPHGAVSVSVVPWPEYGEKSTYPIWAVQVQANDKEFLLHWSSRLHSFFYDKAFTALISRNASVARQAESMVRQALGRCA